MIRKLSLHLTFRDIRQPITIGENSSHRSIVLSLDMAEQELLILVHSFVI